MLTILANAIISPALPAIKNTFIKIENIEIITKLLMTLPALTIAVSAAGIGKLIDRIGSIKILLVSLIIFGVAGTSGYWLPTLPLILLGRFLLGFGVAGIMTATTTLIGNYYTGEARQAFLSLQGAFIGFGGMLFITLAGFLADESWRYPFLVYAFSLVPFMLAYNSLREPVIENKVLQHNTLTNKTQTSARYIIYFSAFTGIALFYILPIQIPFFIKRFSNTSNSLAGFAIGALTTAQAISSIFYKNIKRKINYKTIFSISFVLMALGFSIISISTHYWLMVTGLIICGMGTAWLNPNATLWLMAITPENERGKYIGRLTMSIFLGQFISPILVQPIQDNYGLQYTFLILGIFLLALSLIYTAFIKPDKITLT
jgi:MFS family permease